MLKPYAHEKILITTHVKLFNKKFDRCWWLITLTLTLISLNLAFYNVKNLFNDEKS